jgi:hypothetical protein
MVDLGTRLAPPNNMLVLNPATPASNASRRGDRMLLRFGA